MQIIGCQIDIAWERPRENYDKVERLLGALSVRPGALILLPEMFSTGFSMNVAGIAETATGATAQFLARLARKLQAFVLGGVVTCDPDGRGRNEAAVFSPQGTEIARYQKLHPFSPGKESAHYRAGAELVSFAWHGFSVFPFICYDLRFPEIFRLATRKGATLFPVIANWPNTRENHWVALLQARAIENQAFVAGINRCGRDPVLAYSGRSLIVNPGGEILADGSGKESIVTADIELETVTTYRSQLPFLKDMRSAFFPAGGLPSARR